MEPMSLRSGDAGLSGRLAPFDTSGQASIPQGERSGGTSSATQQGPGGTSGSEQQGLVGTARLLQAHQPVQAQNKSAVQSDTPQLTVPPQH